MPIFDSNVIIEYVKGNKKVGEALTRFKAIFSSSTTYVNEYELLKYRGRHINSLKKFIADSKIYQSSDEAAIFSAEIYNELEDHGNLINENDILIAGICKANNERLITFDKGFKRIPSLDVVVLER